MVALSELHTRVFHSLENQIAVIDCTGLIVDVNMAWREFGRHNGLAAPQDCVGSNYLQTLECAAETGDESATQALQGMRSVLCGHCPHYEFEYPCHSPHEQRWFIMRICPLYGAREQGYFVVTHLNITQRRLAENAVARMAELDPLTGLGNRRVFHQFLTRELRRCLRLQQPLGLLLLDLDHFKTYNDLHGHAAGDQCLQQVAQVLSEHARRPEDLAVRLGGDEFALAYGATSLAQLTQIAQSILRDIRALELLCRKGLCVSASIGMVSLVPDDDTTEGQLYERADQALYRAKAAGRDGLSV
ncbi:diguanylate cyclase domain-containing protein [Roseateles sp. BYS180W]|uniref:diguanylate cyclase n=1 Tax=Roseateles rivi TaxID=3299028 RepID=A0ABW7FTX6_9BURK